MSFYSRYGGALMLPPIHQLPSLQPQTTAQLNLLPLSQFVTARSIVLSSEDIAKTAIPSEHVDHPLLAEESLDSGLSPEPSILQKFGPWLWVVPAGLVAVGLVVVVAKRKSLGGYRRRSRK